MSAPLAPLPLRRLKTLRQKRLREVGEAGQARIEAATLRLASADAASEIALRYLVGAGVHRWQLPQPLRPLASALDPGWTLCEGEPLAELPRAQAPDFLQDDGAKAVFAGALTALTALRAVLAAPEPPA